MGFFSKLFSAIDDSIQKTIELKSNPSKAMSLKEDLVTPRDVSFQGFFKKVDPVLDILSPSHNIVQEATTGSATTEGQSPYFEKIAPIIVSWFFPTAGAFASGVDGVSQGKTTQAVIGFTGYAVGSYANAANAANADIIANGGTASSSLLSNLQTAQTIGKVVNLGVGAYNFYDAQDRMIASTARIANMVSDTQQLNPVYSSANVGTAYGKLAGDGTVSTGQSLAGQVIESSQRAQDNQAFLILAVLGFYLWSKK